MLKLHNWQYDLSLMVHRCTETHPFLHSERENPCNGCGTTIADRDLYRYRELGLPRLTMDLMAAGAYRERKEAAPESNSL